ncbi:16S rRNA (guanine(527)-N(7))-methyltransferase RsmG [Hydrogenimonas cancrithermarum]|uniref:Ribosomal RNA small subunit methyltransferase G n=1 Tax=Hydrogenimonas cancrithermarum TaxID=2993563 RepID=A0ABM8FMF8_9BACT|nr:16S rRNA (guanine(527)-N(7))-methyltransferase RsmG [Hydrogenimonas cancrithermarum]BDY12642.1 ribosomal RNA small subunit methyltransferase G [Hydrogenimonas cancrithermarum]
MSLKRTIENVGIDLSETIHKNLDAFAKHLMKWNRIHNLTGAKTRTAIDTQILDSIWPLTFLPERDSLLDIGTGAGFPGMVLAIALPETECTLCEPLRKRAAFLRFIARELGLKNVTVEAKRVEALEVRPYTLITSRAVTETPTLIDWSRPFVSEGTQMLFYKGEQVFEEIEGLDACGVELISRDKRNYLWIKEASKC